MPPFFLINLLLRFPLYFPFDDIHEDRLECKSLVGEAVLHSDRHFQVFLARDHAGVFELLECFGQHRVGDAFNIAEKVIIAARSVGSYRT